MNVFTSCDSAIFKRPECALFSDAAARHALIPQQQSVKPEEIRYNLALYCLRCKADG